MESTLLICGIISLIFFLASFALFSVLVAKKAEDEDNSIGPIIGTFLLVAFFFGAFLEADKRLLRCTVKTTERPQVEERITITKNGDIEQKDTIYIYKFKDQKRAR